MLKWQRQRQYSINVALSHLVPLLLLTTDWSALDCPPSPPSCLFRGPVGCTTPVLKELSHFFVCLPYLFPPYQTVAPQLGRLSPCP